MAPRYALAYAALAFTSLVWSGNTIAGRALADAIPPAAFSFWRAALGVALLGERLGWYHLAGFAFILAGIAVANGALGALGRAFRPAGLQTRKGGS